MPIENVASQFLSRMPDPAGNLAQGYARGTALGQRDRALDQEQGKINFAQNAAQASTAQQQADEALKRTSALALMALADPSGNTLKEIQSRGGLQNIQTKPQLMELAAAGLGPEKFAQWQQKQGEAPTVKSWQQGDETVTSQWDPQQRQFQEIARGKKGPETQVIVGGPTVINNEPIPLDKTNMSKQQGETFNAQESFARLKGLREAYKPEFLTFGGNVKRWTAEAKDFLGGESWLSDEDKRVIDESSKMMRRTADNLSLFIKDISGAAVSVQEAERLSKALPNDKDSPRVYDQKLKDALDLAQAGLWRRNYALRKGLDPLNSKVSLYDMDSIIESEGKDIELRLRKENPNASDEEIDSMTAQELKGLFGD